MPSFTIPFFSFFLTIDYHPELRLIKRIRFASQNDPTQARPSWAALFLQNLKSCIIDKDYQPDLNWLDLGLLTRNQIAVYTTLAKIGPGKTLSYSQLGQKAQLSPGAARFVGNLMASNPFPIIIPCHRVIRRNGSLGGYAGGVEMKKFLLNQEKMLKFD
ncbi:MAG: hypothetical protein CVV50_02190 [Spirochaetae bacterium HGW-Spirochaetae-6]|nr:MAG: hypothetical protein CVV50_02190 [Spirochaetae bacterium HGW-Spirochaetae-6]